MIGDIGGKMHILEFLCFFCVSKSVSLLQCYFMFFFPVAKNPPPMRPRPSKCDIYSQACLM